MKNRYLALCLAGLSAAAFAAAFLMNVTPVLADGYPLEVRDALNRKVYMAEKPRRIVSLAPALTEIVWAAGAGENLIGRTDFCNYPAECKTAKSVGGIVNFSIEQIVALKPDLVIVQRITPRDAVDRMISLNLTVVAFEEPETLGGILELIERVGLVVGESPAARRLATDKQKILDAARTRMDRFGENRIRVYYGGFSAPYITAGADTFIDDLITVAGGSNIATKVRGAAKPVTGWPQLSAEEIAAANPQVILASCVETMGGNSRSSALIESAKRNPVFAKTAAVKRGAICIIDADVLQRPGPRIFDALEMFAKFLDEVRID